MFGTLGFLEEEEEVLLSQLGLRLASWRFCRMSVKCRVTTKPPKRASMAVRMGHGIVMRAMRPVTAMIANKMKSVLPKSLPLSTWKLSVLALGLVASLLEALASYSVLFVPIVVFVN